MEEEKQNLETQTEETTTTEETPVAEDSKVVEKDGEVYIRMDTDESDPKEEPEEGESSEDNQKVEGTSEDKPEAQATDQEVDTAYKDKSVSDMIQMHKDATRKISEQGAEIGKLKDSVPKVDPRDMSVEEIIAGMSAEQLKGAYQEAQAKLTAMDQAIDEATFLTQQNMVNSLKDDWESKVTEERIRAEFNSRDNEEFVEKIREDFKEKGVELSDSEFNHAKEIAQDYLENGRYTDKSFQKALVDIVGVEKMTKFYAMKGEEKARQDITKASEKVENKIDVRGSGKNSKLLNVGKLKTHEFREAIKDLSPQQLEQLKSTINK
jgi:hypothetical protein